MSGKRTDSGVDEAHCISRWGHAFRPDYLRLSAVFEALGRPAVLASTATASPPVRQEITERLGTDCFVQTPDRRAQTTALHKPLRPEY